MRNFLVLLTIILLSTSAGLFAQDAENVEQVGRIYNYWSEAWDVVVVDDLAYVATRLYGLQIVNVSNPEHPEEVGYCDTPQEAYGVAVSGDFAYVADDESGLSIISVANPEHPEEVGYCDTPDRAFGVTVSGDYAYIADGNSGLRVILVVDPEHPQEVGYCSGYARGVTVSGEYAYVAADYRGLRVISVADPEHPQEVGNCDTLAPAFAVAVSGDYAYIADSPDGDEYDEYYYGDLRVILVSDPECPIEVGYYNTLGSARGVALSEDGLIYVADGTNVGIYRFTDPANVDDEANYFAAEFNLFAAFPNPFNSTTTIEDRLPFASDVSLNLYNLSGQRIETLVNGRLQAGVHRVTLNAEDMSSGLYFVKLEGAGQSFTRKLMLLK